MSQRERTTLSQVLLRTQNASHSDTTKPSRCTTETMAASTSTGRVAGTRLNTSYISFDSDRGVRSPRTPTYVPDFSSTTSVPPFDHAKFFAEPTSDTENRRSIPPPPPEKPMDWMWICHLCHSRYALGVTRRCLVDGHYYCSGESDKPSLRKKKKPKACSSEFDYAAWKQWGEWRRKVLRAIHNERVFKGCEYCDFPSQCRYAADAHPLGDALKSPKAPVSEPKAETKTKEEDASKSTANGSVDFDQILKSIFSEADSTVDAKPAKGASKKKRSGKSLLPSLEEEVVRDEKRLRELVGMNCGRILRMLSCRRRSWSDGWRSVHLCKYIYFPSKPPTYSAIANIFSSVYLRPTICTLT